MLLLFFSAYDLRLGWFSIKLTDLNFPNTSTWQIALFLRHVSLPAYHAVLRSNLHFILSTESKNIHLISRYAERYGASSSTPIYSLPPFNLFWLHNPFTLNSKFNRPHDRSNRPVNIKTRQLITSHAAISCSWRLHVHNSSSRLY